MQSVLDIGPSRTDSVFSFVTAMPTIRSMAEMALLVSATVAVLVIAALVL
jgi:hypothetical protein